MSIQKRLDDISERLKRQQNASPPPGVKATIDYDQLDRDVDEFYTGRARRILARGDVPILSDDEIAALKPTHLPDGSINYDQLGPYMDAFYLAKVAANKQPPTAGDARQKD